ncbi:sentrin-specific protease 7 isoform X1 [Tetranychus urticae]|nr:sentrin-specific protease 7 isoform X1 [Tetranychus urticae]
MDIDPIPEEIILNIRNVFFGTHRVVCENISLATNGLKFNKVALTRDNSRFNITIPPTDIQQAWFCPDLVVGCRTLLIKTVPDSGSKICAALQLKPNVNHSDEYSEEESIRVTIQFAGDESGSVQEQLSQYFSAFTNLDWDLEIIESAEVVEYLEYLYKQLATPKTPPSPSPSSTPPSSSSPPPPSSPLPPSPQPQPQPSTPPSTPPVEHLIKENDDPIIQCATVLNRSTKTYSSLLPKMHPSRTSSPKTPSSLRPKLNIQRLRSNDPPSIIDIEIDDEDDTENQSNLNASGTSCSDSDIVLDYPPGESDSITIYKRDLTCLEEGEFLTDTILGFHLKYIHRHLTDPGIAGRTYIFSTFFYVKLTKSRKEDTQLSTNIADRYYNRVKNWTKNLDIFDKDYLIIPINKSYHWFLAIICYPKKVPDHDEILPIEIEKNPTRPCILFMDSLQGANRRYRLAEPIRHFLAKEWEFKKKTKKNFSSHVMPEYYLKVPKQNNHSDCGLYVLQYVESFLRNPGNLLEKVISNSSLDGWFHLSLVANKRRNIKRLINRLKEENGKNNSVKMETDS